MDITPNRPLLLDLYCCAGGAAMGYYRAGFDVIGVDIDPQPHYPFRFMQADALYVLDGSTVRSLRVAAIHASPPCRDHTKYTARWGRAGSGNLLEETRALLEQTGLPWVIENVPGAPMRADLKLCGCMFDLPGLRRERWFESPVDLGGQLEHRPHVGHTVTVSGHPGGSSKRDGKSGFGSTADWRRAMGIDWMPARRLAQAIPPAYTEYVGQQLMNHIREQEKTA